MVRQLVTTYLMVALLFYFGSKHEKAGAEVNLRIVRSNLAAVHIHGMSEGYARRWWRNLRNPSFCTMTLCHGSCASAHRSVYDDSIIGTPSFYDQKTGGPDELTPCGLRTFHHLLEAQACCQH